MISDKMTENNLATMDAGKLETTLGLPQKSFDDLYMLSRPQKRSLKSKVNHYCQSHCKLSLTSIWRLLEKRIPVLDWIFKYDVTNNLMSDLVGGLTVGIMQIPQGMAYSLLANMPPVVGLYVSFFSVLVYFLLGTSKHLSLGTFAVVSLMTGKVVQRYMIKKQSTSFINETSSEFLLFNGTMIPTISPETDVDLVTLQIQIGAAVAFFVGILQILMALLQLGNLSVYLSDTLVSGFTTGAAVHVLSSQVKYIFGISVPSYSGIGAVAYTYTDIYNNIYLTNHVALAISLAVIVSLVLVNDYVNAKYKEKMIMPIPMELLVIAASTFASYYFNLNGNYNIQIVKEIPIGVPSPALPRLDVIPDIATDCIALAIVSYCIPISLAKIFAKRNKYEVDANQEIFAYGAGNVVGSCFSCFPSCASLSRSSVQETSGAKTQVASVVSCGLVLFVLLIIAPLFEPMPNCVLAGIIIVALRGMFRQIKDLITAWFISRREAAVWLVAFTAVVLLDVDLGLLVSISFLLITVLYRLQRPYVTEMGKVPSTDIYLDLHKYKVTHRIKGIKIIHFGGALYFANREYFKQECYKLAFDPQKELAIRKKIEKKSSFKTINDEHQQKTTSSDHIITNSEKCNIDKLTTVMDKTANGNITNNGRLTETPSAIIIDCSVMSFIDMAAIATLSQLHSEYEEMGIQLYLCAFNDNVLMKMERTELFNKIKTNVFPTIHHAVMHITTIVQTDVSKSLSDPMRTRL